MPHLTVIGIGSPFGDDQAGWRIAESLAESVRVAAYGKHVLVTACRSPSSELLELLSNTDVAILVDAVLGGGAPGTVYRIASRHIPPFVTEILSSHGIGLQAMIELVDALESSPRVMIVYGIEAGPIGADSAMSEGVYRAVVRVVEEIKRDMAHYCAR
jgi:hydrogenase maturation protease